MAIEARGQKVLSAVRVARADHPELADLLDFYGDLYQVQFEAKAAIPDPPVRDELAVRWRLEGGIPQLTFDQLGIESTPFAALLAELTDVLLRHNPSWRIHGGGVEPDRLLAWAREAFETWDTLTAPKPHVQVMDDGEQGRSHTRLLAVGFALAPYLQRAAEAILPLLNLSLWAQNYCPICGGRPNLALLRKEDGARHLLCSRCNSLWPYRRVGCPFCKSPESQTYYLSSDGVYRLYVCPTCTQYLKTVDLRELHRPVYPEVERLLTVGMDLAAHGEGYGN